LFFPIDTLRSTFLWVVTLCRTFRRNVLPPS
jgi:hypothetical protein